MYWELLSYRDKKGGEIIGAKYRCTECGYVVDKIFPIKWWKNPAYPWPHIVHMEKFVDECPNCHEKITMSEYIEKTSEICQKELDRIGHDIHDLYLELATEKMIQSEKKYI
jgi:predicted RNA-binding Zn-ribbon protein involved in translation (DUF1610 family)